MNLEQLNESYRRTLGFPSRASEFFARGRKVEVFKWEPSEHASDVFLYVTSGFSLYEFSDDPSHRAELFIGLIPDEDGVARGVAATAFELMFRDVVPQHGLVVTFAEHLWPAAPFVGFVITHPLVEVVPAIEVDEVHVFFYQLIPVTQSEGDYIRKNGYEALRLIWESSRVPFWDPHRSPAASSV